MGDVAHASADEFTTRRHDMVERQIVARGILDEPVLAAMRTVPRERFVPAALLDQAYADNPLPIGKEQTISQPYIVAAMLELANLAPRSRVLEVGTGSGYAAALIGAIVAEVYGIERHESLVDRARANLAAAGCTNVDIVAGDGWRGRPEHSPYDAIIVSAAPIIVPPALREQLRIGGRMVIPVGRSRDTQRLRLVRRLGIDRFDEQRLSVVRFVPLVSDPSSRDVARTT
jgi:protein-L-isoaspartate(D-aspartate) O-methyltransferase